MNPQEVVTVISAMRGNPLTSLKGAFIAAMNSPLPSLVSFYKRAMRLGLPHNAFGTDILKVLDRHDPAASGFLSDAVFFTLSLR